MTETMSIAEMAVPVNYAGMNYKGLSDFVKANINPLLEAKRQEDMIGITHTYVSTMREFASDNEIVYSVMREVMSDSHLTSPSSSDVDEQMQTVNEAQSSAHNVNLSSGKAPRLSEKELVNLAIETVKGLPAPEGVNSKMSYYACYVFKKSSGELNLEKAEGWNMDSNVLNNLRITHKMRTEEHYKNVKTITVGDYNVYLLSGGKCMVAQFNSSDGVEPYVVDATQIPVEFKAQIDVDMDLAEVIKALPESSTCESEQNDESASESLMETFPENQESARIESSTSAEHSLIDKAVEITKAMRVGVMTDPNAPYFIQDEFKVAEDGNLSRPSRPFSMNIRPDEFEKYKDSHKKRAHTYNASYISCTDDFTAYITDEGKTVCVYLYHRI